MILIDSHAHISDDALISEADGILERARQSNINAVINICTGEGALLRGLELHKHYPWMYNAAAIPPHDVEANGERLFPLMAKHARNGDLVAVGETGLDYHYHTHTKELQQQFLRRYFELALECHLPVVIHCRDAFADFFSILDADYRIGSKHGPGVLHCFTGTMAEAEQVIERGWYLSLSGIVTFKKSIELREVAKRVPLEQLLIETDTPYLAPQSKRGKTNEPAYLTEIAAVVADAKGISVEELARVTVDNARSLFQLPITVNPAH